MPDNLKPPGPTDDKTISNPEADDFFQRLPANFRWPKPNAEAIAAAAESILRMGGSSPIVKDSSDQAATDTTEVCAGCGGSLPAAARFCVWCGLPKEMDGASMQNAALNARHHFHHHYHHLVPAPGTAVPTTTAESESASPRGQIGRAHV